jgi:hypothetical protein
MISRSTLIGALVVAELGIVGLAAKAVAGDHMSLGHHSGGFGAHRGFDFARAADAPVRFDKTFATGAAPHVVVDVHDVDVVIEGAAQPAVRAVETLHVAGYVSGTIAPIAAQPSPDGVRITAGGEGAHVMIGDLTRLLRVTVPQGAQVEILSAGRIETAGLRAKLIAHTPSGDIHVRDHRGDLDVSSSSGKIDLVDVQGTDIAANTHDGRLYLTRVGADRIDAHSNYGRIYAVDVRAVDGALSTHSGRISASFTANSDATVAASTRDGNVTVSGLPSTSSGSQARTVTLGTGRGHFEVSTDDGAVNISQGANV